MVDCYGDNNAKIYLIDFNNNNNLTQNTNNKLS